MLMFEVVGMELMGELFIGMMVIDLVFIIIEMFWVEGVVGKFVEFFGIGIVNMSLVDCVMIVNMVFEYGVMMGFFLIDIVILGYFM